jgi:hypothetical protein
VRTGFVVVFAGLLCSCARHTTAVRNPPAPEPTREAEAENDVRAPWDPPIDREERQEWYRARKNFAARLREVRTQLGTAAPASPGTTVNPSRVKARTHHFIR